MSFNTNITPTTEDLCRSYLLCYTAHQFEQYQIAPHHQMIARYLEAIEKREIKRLLITMPPRHGKCQIPEIITLLADGSRKTLRDLEIGDEVAACNDGKLTSQTVVAKEPAFKATIKITTRTGRSITVSHDHPMLTFDGYKPAEDMTLEDNLVAIHKEIDHNFEIPDTELDFITCMIFDGCCRQNIMFTKLDKVIINTMQTACDNLGIRMHRTKSLKIFDHAISRVTAVPLLEKYGINGHLCYDKRLPPEFFRMSLRQKWRFIGLMFQTDGYFCQSAGNGGIALANEGLINDIQSLLSTCAIASAKTYKKNDKAGAWVLTIGKSQLHSIYRNCDLGSKRSQCKKIIDKSTTDFSMLTTFPWQLGKTLRRTMANGFRCDNKKNITRERLIRMSKVYPELEKYLEMDFIYDKVVKLEEGPGRDLIHIQVTGTQNFIANDFVSHNTMLASEFFPAWYLGRNPDHEVMFATYSKERAQDVGLKIKSQLENPRFSEVFKTKLRADSKSKAHLVTQEGGALYAAGVGGALTGRGANLFIMDDLVKSREEAESELSRRRVIEWFKGTAYTRLMKEGVIVLIMTRWHTQDLAGIILDEYKKDWVHLDMPAICTKPRDKLGRKRGESLWPEMFSEKDLKEIRRIIGTREFNSQYQQRPIGEEGSIVKLHWFERYAVAPAPDKFRRIIQSWDTAYDSKSTHDPSVGTVWGEHKETKRLYLLDVWRNRAEYPMVRKAIFSMYARWPTTNKILIENRTSGKSIVKDLEMTNLPILPVLGEGDKVVRLMTVSGMIEAGKVILPETAPWLYDYETEMCQFPLGKHDDQVDSTSQALSYLKQPAYVAAAKKLFWK